MLMSPLIHRSILFVAKFYIGLHKSTYPHIDQSSLLLNFILASKRVDSGLQPSILTSLSTSNTYFLCVREIPFLFLATSIPKNFFSCASSLISNSLANVFHTFSNSAMMFPVKMISSTQTIRIASFLVSECL